MNIIKSWLIPLGYLIRWSIHGVMKVVNRLSGYKVWQKGKEGEVK